VRMIHLRIRGRSLTADCTHAAGWLALLPPGRLAESLAAGRAHHAQVAEGAAFAVGPSRVPASATRSWPWLRKAALRKLLQHGSSSTMSPRMLRPGSNDRRSSTFLSALNRMRFDPSKSSAIRYDGKGLSGQSSLDRSSPPSSRPPAGRMKPLRLVLLQNHLLLSLKNYATLNQ